MTTRARFVIRPAGDGRGDLILGAMFKKQGDLLKPNTVYEIREVLGELVIAPVGPAALGENRRMSWLPNASWANDAGYILDCYPKEFVLTQEEWKQECAK